MKTIASMPTWIKKKDKAIKKNLCNRSRRPQEDNGQIREKCKIKLELFGREIEEKVKTLRNEDYLLRVQKHYKGR